MRHFYSPRKIKGGRSTSHQRKLLGKKLLRRFGFFLIKMALSVVPKICRNLPTNDGLNFSATHQLLLFTVIPPPPGEIHEKIYFCEIRK